MEVPEPAESADSPVTTRPKRSRTGCLTCRTRRRKCDEGKPVCRNCITKGFGCRYAAAFQILGKNNYTPEVPSNVTYGNVQFVGDKDKKPAGEDEEQAASRTVANTSRSPISPINLGLRKSLTETESQPEQTNNTPSPNSYEFAIHGLLALGCGSGSNDILTYSPQNPSHEPAVTSSFERVLGAPAPSMLRGFSGRRISELEGRESWQSASPPQAPAERASYGRIAPAETAFAATSESGPNSTRHTVAVIGSNERAIIHQTDIPEFSTPEWMTTPETVPPEFALELLKYYRYHIAPWLDICDSNQCFGVEVLGLSAEVTTVRHAILVVADASMNNPGISRIQELVNSKAREQDVINKALSDLFWVLKDVVTDLAKFWSQEEDIGYGRQILDALLPVLGNASSLASSMYWLLVRLVLGCGLMATTPVRIPLPFIAEQLFRSADNDNIARCAQNSIALCVDALMFSQGDEDRWLQHRYGLNRLEVWKTLIQGFVHWYRHRPQEFQPVIELYPKDGVQSVDDFPMIVFTGGAATLANQLYHTGMLLLLQNKPRFANRLSSNSSSMSTLWHAHRICGIAIQNDGPGSWDPCLVASLLVAARTVTHGSQHAAIVYTLETVQRLTGWNISRYTDELRAEWQPADGR